MRDDGAMLRLGEFAERQRLHRQHRKDAWHEIEDEPAEEGKDERLGPGRWRDTVRRRAGFGRQGQKTLAAADVAHDQDAGERRVRPESGIRGQAKHQTPRREAERLRGRGADQAGLIGQEPGRLDMGRRKLRCVHVEPPIRGDPGGEGRRARRALAGGGKQWRGG